MNIYHIHVIGGKERDIIEADGYRIEDNTFTFYVNVGLTVEQLEVIAVFPVNRTVIYKIEKPPKR